MTLANQLTLFRIGLVPLAAWAILAGWSIPAATLIALAGATDYFDGRIARGRGEVSPLGTALDPIADKILTVLLLLAFGAAGTLNGLHLLPAFLICFREILIGGLRDAFAKEGGALPVSRLAKVKTSAQFAALFLLALGPSPLALAALWLAAALTLWTGIDYLRRLTATG